MFQERVPSGARSFFVLAEQLRHAPRGERTQPRAEADEALESRSALEEIERALGEARVRIAGIR